MWHDPGTRALIQLWSGAWGWGRCYTADSRPKTESFGLNPTTHQDLISIVIAVSTFGQSTRNYLVSTSEIILLADPFRSS